ncbi:phage tail protein I [Paenibacillus antibioticophila]|uniref:phage tail protein I n=1 Tax=Paenibacillus antibioticophila TaxID=1274374 RepID=UPI0005CB11AE|nr:phage tail protein I [Paenibacillus antibioticophila]
MDLQNLNMLKLQTKFMRQDKSVVGYSAAVEEQFKKISNETDKAMIYARINELPGEVLDILAWQFGADWYDASVDIEVKREAIKDVLYLAKIRGTPAAVQRIVEIYFGDGRVEEWFEYGGNPGYFRVLTSNPEATNEKAQQFTKAVESVKRKSQWLEAVVLEETISIDDLYFGGVLHIGEYITI